MPIFNEHMHELGDVSDSAGITTLGTLLALPHKEGLGRGQKGTAAPLSRSGATGLAAGCKWAEPGWVLGSSHEGHPAAPALSKAMASSISQLSANSTKVDTHNCSSPGLSTHGYSCFISASIFQSLM